MSKLTYEDKIKMYEEYKNGIGYSKLAKKYNIRRTTAEYLLYLIDKHGYDILRKNKNKTYSKCFKEEAINRVLISGEAKWAVRNYPVEGDYYGVRPVINLKLTT